VTVYLDTSSLVKLYVAEAGSDVIHKLVGEADVVATSVAPTRSARRFCEASARRGAHRSALTAAKHAFEEQWPTYLTLEATDSLCRAAASSPKSTACEVSTAFIWRRSPRWLVELD